MLRLLAQFDIRMPGTENVPSVSAELWFPGVGLVANGSAVGDQYGNRYGGYGILALDGIFRDRVGGNIFGSTPYPGYWPAKKRLVVAWNNSDEEMTFEPYVFARQASGPPNSELAKGLKFQHYVKLDDRSVYYGGHSVQGVVNGVVTPEGPAFPFEWYSGALYPGRDETEVFIAAGLPGQPPMGVFYDTTKKALSSPYMYIDLPAKFLGFASEFGVVLSIHGVDQFDPPTTYEQLRIWSTEVEPAVLSPVEILRGELKSGQVVTYRVKVTGDKAEPCEDETVNWTITRDLGTLLDFQSKTDKEGYATTRVQYGVGESGLSYVEASLAC